MSKESPSINLEPKMNIWQDKDLVKEIKTYDFDSLLTNLDKFKISYIGMGFYGIVFRVQNIQSDLDITLKLMRFGSSLNSEALNSLFKASKIPISKELANLVFLKDYRSRSKSITKNLVLMQAAGHKLGNMIAPKYIDPPVALWTKDNQPFSPELIGYSLPYVNGTPIKICKDNELNNIANWLEENYNLFLGSRGTSIIRGSKNAIVLPDNQKKFIDVRLKTFEDYSVPNFSNFQNSS